MKKVAIIQARMGSTRFPGKILEHLLDKPLLEWVVTAASQIPLIDQVVIATTARPEDQAVVKWCNDNKIHFFQGDEHDVLARFYETAKMLKAGIIVRLTADCPLLDPNIAGQVLFLVANGHAEYASNTMPATWPDGLDCEAFTFNALEQAFLRAVRPSDREHVTPYIRNNQKIFKAMNVPSPIPGLQHHRWTVDEPEDLEYLQKLLKLVEKKISIYIVLEMIQKSPHLKQHFSQRNEGFTKTLKAEKNLCEDFSISKALLKKAVKVIPLGAQTFSKSYIQYPENTSPMFLTHGQGGRVWDVDGNEYVDLISALLPNVLGYADPEVNFAIHNQLQKGISFSLSTELEIELAEKLCEHIPSAESVRFAKNGSDVTAAAVRLARAYTGREKIMVSGYHGWQDWYIGSTTRNKGVPKSVSALTTLFPYNDLNKVEELLKTEEFAAIVMEPCNVQAPLPDYLKGVKSLCEKYGSLLIFDEVITGFRFALGGAQSYFGVTPHLSCFGKAMGNGMPISAVVGRADIMKEMEEIFFSGTFGGEALSIAASLATIEKIENQKVIEHLWSYGEALSKDVETLIESYALEDVVGLQGYAPWKILKFNEVNGISSFAIKTYFQQEMIRRGILIAVAHNVCFTHNVQDKVQILRAYKETLESMHNFVHSNDWMSFLKSPIVKPLFKVR